MTIMTTCSTGFYLLYSEMKNFTNNILRLLGVKPRKLYILLTCCRDNFIKALLKGKLIFTQIQLGTNYRLFQADLVL